MTSCSSLNQADLEMIRGPEWMHQAPADGNKNHAESGSTSSFFSMMNSLISKAMASLSSENNPTEETLEEQRQRQIHDTMEETRREFSSMGIDEFRRMRGEMTVKSGLSARQMIHERISTGVALKMATIKACAYYSATKVTAIRSTRSTV
jgi:hypothetical protein